MTTRRGMLKLLAAAPAAVPIAAKEAAAKMGLGTSVFGGAAGGGMETARAGYADKAMGPCAMPQAMQLADYQNQLKRLLSPESLAGIRDAATRNGVQLDPDLASLRTISPSAARQIQIDRNVQRIIASERRWIDKRISELTGGLL